MKKKHVSRTSALIVFFIILISIFSFKYVSEDNYVVTRVIDGDTIEIQIEDKTRSVRLLGVDAPEKGQCYFNESKEYLATLLENEIITMKADPLNNDTDEYGRLLRYVYLESGSLVNEILIRSGFAKSLPYFETHLKGLLNGAEQEAREENSGLWETCN